MEVDETFVGGKAQNMHSESRDRFAAESAHMAANGKAIVMGMLDRDERKVRAPVVPNAKRETLQGRFITTYNADRQSMPTKP